MHYLEEGYGELTLFFDQKASEETRYQFEEFIAAHLRRRALPESIFRRRLFICPKCTEEITDRQATRRREAGHKSIICPVCDTEISLLDRKERLQVDRPSLLLNMDRAADSQRELETAESVLQGKIIVHDTDRHKWELLVIKRRRINELEKQRAYNGATTPPAITMEIEDLERDIQNLEDQLRRATN